MITIDLKATHDTGVVHARGTIGGKWLFNRYHIHGMSIVYTVPPIHVAYRWVASYAGQWSATFPGGLNRDGKDAVKVMGWVNERLKEVYPGG